MEKKCLIGLKKRHCIINIIGSADRSASSFKKIEMMSYSTIKILSQYTLRKFLRNGRKRTLSNFRCIRLGFRQVCVNQSLSETGEVPTFKHKNTILGTILLHNQEAHHSITLAHNTITIIMMYRLALALMATVATAERFNEIKVRLRAHHPCLGEPPSTYTLRI